MALLGCAVCQRRLIYFPKKDSPAVLDELAKSAGLERWRNFAGQNIGWKRMSRFQPAAGQVLITHGNAGCALDRVDYANVIDQAAALDVLVLEYPGFSDRPGSPSESELFRAAEEGLQALPRTNAIYVVGESLGTGLIVDLCQDDVPRHLTMFTRATLGRMLRNTSLEPIDWSCGQDLCGGSVRGWMNFITKRLGGEPMSDVLSQNRAADGGGWPEFAGRINGRPSSFLSRVDALDGWLAPRLDRVLDRLGFGFIMTVHARKPV